MSQPKLQMILNVLGVVSFDLTFPYAHDPEVLRDALRKGLVRRDGKYYLADAGYALTRYTLRHVESVSICAY